jgi:undecaprenyl-diphosphatase
MLVSYSRVYLGVHYPGDILGGAILGLLIANALNRWRSTPNFKY